MDAWQLFILVLFALLTVGMFLFLREAGVKWNFRKNTPPGKAFYMFTLSMALVLVGVIVARWLTDPFFAFIGGVIVYAGEGGFLLSLLLLSYAVGYQDGQKVIGSAISARTGKIKGEY